MQPPGVVPLARHRGVANDRSHCGFCGRPLQWCGGQHRPVRGTRGLPTLSRFMLLRRGALNGEGVLWRCPVLAEEFGCTPCSRGPVPGDSQHPRACSARARREPGARVLVPDMHVVGKQKLFWHCSPSFVTSSMNCVTSWSPALATTCAASPMTSRRQLCSMTTQSNTSAGTEVCWRLHRCGGKVSLISELFKPSPRERGVAPKRKTTCCRRRRRGMRSLRPRRHS